MTILFLIIAAMIAPFVVAHLGVQAFVNRVSANR